MLRGATSGAVRLAIRRTIVLAIAFATLAALGCAESAALGDGTLEGTLPSGWHDVELTAEQLAAGVVLMIHDDTVPLPLEIVVRRLDLQGSLEGNDWSSIADVTVPAPRTRVGEAWQDNTRRMHRFRSLREALRFAGVYGGVNRDARRVKSVRAERARASLQRVNRHEERLFVSRFNGPVCCVEEFAPGGTEPGDEFPKHLLVPVQLVQHTFRVEHTVALDVVRRRL